jgi:hypothetical protein
MIQNKKSKESQDNNKSYQENVKKYLRQLLPRPSPAQGKAIKFREE